MSVGPDRVQVIKQESAANGGDGADDVVYTTPIQPQEDALEAAGLYLQDASNRDEAVYIERAGSALRFVDADNPAGFSLSQLSGGGGLSTSQHAALDTLVHNIAESSYVQVVRTSGRVSSVVIWTNSSMTTKIREVLYARTSGQLSSVTTKQYDGSGTLVATLTQTISRTSGLISSADGVLT